MKTENKTLGEQRKIRCVIYDCDGVVLDSLESNRRFYNHFRISLGRPPLTEDELKYAHTHTMQEALRLIFGGDEDLVRKALQLRSAMAPEENLRSLELEPNILPVLQRLKEREILRAMNTSRSDTMKPILEKFGLAPYFDLIVTTLDVRNPKPHPESVEKIICTLSLSKGETVLVGDSEVDRKTAEAAGVTFIAYKNKEIAADALIEDHFEILNLLGPREQAEEE